MVGRKTALEKGLDLEKLASDYESGLTWEEVGQKQGVSESTAQKYGTQLVPSRDRTEARLVEFSPCGKRKKVPKTPQEGAVPRKESALSLRKVKTNGSVQAMEKNLKGILVCRPPLSHILPFKGLEMEIVAKEQFGVEKAVFQKWLEEYEVEW